MENLIGNIANLGFPIVISMYLLVRIEEKLDTLSKTINILSENIQEIRLN